MYNICKYNVRYLIREKKERFGEGLLAVIEILSKTFASKTIFAVWVSDIA